ncbi:MAG: DUF6069 family protein [Gemmatimonadota bacterium]|jgi:hypothetical protein
MKGRKHRSRREPAPEPGSLWSAGLCAALYSAVVNAALVLAGVVAGIFPRLHLLPFRGSPFGLGSAVVVSMLAALIGTALYSLIWRRAERPLQVFGLLVSSVLLVSFAAPMFVDDWTAVRLTLIELTHLIVAGFTLWSVWRWTRDETHYLEARG